MYLFQMEGNAWHYIHSYCNTHLPLYVGMICTVLNQKVFFITTSEQPLD